MKLQVRLLAITTVGFCLTTTSGLSFLQGSLSSKVGLVDVSESTPRDVATMKDWATMYGAQTADGFQLAASSDGKDFSVITQQDVPAGTPVVFVPNAMILASYQAVQEFGESLQQAEAELKQELPESALPLFRLFVKILIEYEKGQESPWYPWLNSMPRLFNTGSAMTYACFQCLPPYAAGLAMDEREQLAAFQNAAKLLPLEKYDTCTNVEVLKWAYNVANTRSTPCGQERMIAPMADMFNHGAYPSVEINYDEQGNCMVHTTRDVSAGSPLEVSLGDPVDPSPLFAKYGFFDESSPASFCKLMQYQNEMKQLGYTFSNLLFYKETGEVSMEVYDVVLYALLLKNDESLAQGFYQAVVNSDEATKTQYHQQYFPYTKDELQKHVDGTLKNLDDWCFKARSYDPETHPRVPVILKHNAFVKETFLRVKQNLDRM